MTGELFATASIILDIVGPRPLLLFRSSFASFPARSRILNDGTAFGCCGADNGLGPAVSPFIVADRIEGQTAAISEVAAVHHWQGEGLLHRATTSAAAPGILAVCPSPPKTSASAWPLSTG